MERKESGSESDKSPVRGGAAEVTRKRSAQMNGAEG